MMGLRICPVCHTGAMEEFESAFACDNVNCNYYEVKPIVSIKPHGIETETAQKRTNDDSGDPFIKYDENKPMLSLIDPDFIIELGKLMTFGANKYEIDNWKKCEDPRRYKDALLRHLYSYLSGEMNDPESGFEHTVAIAFNVMALRYFDNRNKRPL